MRSLIVIAVALWCAGCGSDAEPLPRSSAPAYAGPLTAEAAVDALECDGRTPKRGRRVDYDDGLAESEPSVEGAFADAVENAGFAFTAPVDGYRVERQEDHRALLSYDAGERTKVAIVLADGIHDYKDDTGWGVVAWAQCDPAEFPAKVSDALGIGVWEDDAGERLPVSRVRSRQGPEHCDWQGITFLLVGPGDARSDWYVRDTTGELAQWLHGRFEADATVPKDATDTGWQRDGRRLWLGEDAAYVVDGSGAAERWPKATQPIMCS